MRLLPWTPELYRYVLEHSTPLGPEAEELIEVTPGLTGMPTMQIPADQAMLLRFLVGALGATSVLEIGTFTGLSALAMASGLGTGGRMVCLDRSAEWTDIARTYWGRAGLADRIELRLGPALESLAAMGGDETFDFVFIDADKPAYPDYYEAVLARLRPGGVIAVDNVLWSGRVADGSDLASDTEAIRRFNDRVASDPRVEVVMLPMSDGITLVRRRTAGGPA
jgi:caffeoyl-CoA O-methyltransferase